MTGASERMVERAKKVKARSPSKLEKVKVGELTLGKAERDKAKIQAARQRRQSAIARIRQVCGEEFASAVERGSLLRTHNDLLAFAAQTDDEMKEQQGLIEVGWPFARAKKFRAKSLTRRHTLGDLFDKTASSGMSLEVTIDGWEITVRRTKSALK